MLKIFVVGVSMALFASNASAQDGAMMVGKAQANLLRAGTPVILKTIRELTTKGKHLKVGDRFPLAVC
jgi:hypothetical protein